MSNFRSNFVALHIITNGENPSIDSIIAVEARLIVAGEIEKEFFSYVKPIQPLSATITLLTDIHNLDLLDAPIIDEVLARLSTFVDSYPIVLESAYEIEFLQSALSGVDPDINNRLINLLCIMAAKYPEYKNFPLAQIGQQLGITKEATSDLERIVLLYGHSIVGA